MTHAPGLGAGPPLRPAPGLQRWPPLAAGSALASGHDVGRGPPLTFGAGMAVAQAALAAVSDSSSRGVAVGQPAGGASAWLPALPAGGSPFMAGACVLLGPEGHLLVRLLHPTLQHQNGVHACTLCTTHAGPCALCAYACRLCERQTRSGGLNGRPEKLQDVSNRAGQAAAHAGRCRRLCEVAPHTRCHTHGQAQPWCGAWRFLLHA